MPQRAEEGQGVRVKLLFSLGFCGAARFFPWRWLECHGIGSGRPDRVGGEAIQGFAFFYREKW